MAWDNVHLRVTLGLPALLAIVGCGTPREGTAPPPPATFTIQRVDPVQHLFRASMALRGIRPSLEEMAAVQADPSQLEPIVRGYAETDDFDEMIKDMHAETLLIRADTQPVLPSMGPLEDTKASDIYESAAEAPLELIKYIVKNNHPYTEIVTADYMLANPTLALEYGVPYDRSNPEEWQISNWTDGRPPSGVLSDTALWLRFTSNGNNFHRGRANTISRVFLCEEFAKRDIIPDATVDLSDPLAVSSLVQSNPNCIACHQALDPLAANFWGFKDDLVPTAVEQAYNDYNCEGMAQDYCYPLRFYTPKNEGSWQDWNLPPPAYYGTPVSDFDDLGNKIAEDERFHECTARHFYSYLTETRSDDVPLETVLKFTDTFDNSGYSAKELAIQIVLSDEFATMYASDGAMDAFAGLQTIRPEQLGRTIEDLTGFRFLIDPGCAGGCWGTEDVANSDLDGYRSMLGGIDGYQVTRPSHTPIPTKILAMQRFAEEAAGYMVPRDLDEPDHTLRHLLTQVERDTTDEAAIRAQLVAIHQRMFGEALPTTDVEIGAEYDLWKYGLDGHAGDTQEAWMLLISGLFQDPRLMFY